LCAGLQALQLQLLRHFAQQLLGTSQQAQLPELLLRDAQQPSDSGTCDDVSAASKNLQLLKELQAMSSKWMTPGVLQQPWVFAC
jgi:hypothetical protein